MAKDNCNIKLGNTNDIPKIMIGTFKVNDYQTMKGIVAAAVNEGCFGFDTSPSYGSEEYLGRAVSDVTRGNNLKRESFFISNKIDGWQMYQSNGEVEKFVDQSLEKMELEYFDSLLIHWPFAKYIYKTWESFERIYIKGKAKSIGLCNINIRILDDLINSRINIVPHIIQNEISPLRVCESEVNYYNSKGIMVQAYSPLCRMINPISTSSILGEIASKHSKSIAQIILRWNIERGVIPIFTSTKSKRISSNLNIFDFSLSSEDIRLINSMDQNYKIFPESYGCPGY